MKHTYIHADIHTSVQTGLFVSHKYILITNKATHIRYMQAY